MCKLGIKTASVFGALCFSAIVIASTLPGCGNRNSGEPAVETVEVGSKSKDATLIRIGTVGADVMDEVRTFQPLVEYLNKQPALAAYAFKAVAAPDHEAMVKMLDDKKVEIFVDSPFPIVKLQERTSLKILLRRSKKGVKEYHSVVFVRKDSGITSVDELEGRVIAFEDPSSTSSYALPCATLIQDGKTLVPLDGTESPVPEGAIGYVFSEDDENTFLWVIKGKVSAGATNNVAFEGMPPAQRDQLSIIYRTEPVARHIVSAREDLDDDFLQLFTDTLIKMHETEAGMEALKAFEKTADFDRVPDREAMVREISQLIATLDANEVR